jgi:hypothetical protein
MAHFAEIDSNNIVLRVLATDNNDPAGDEGYQWLIDNLGGTWVKTSYNSKIRYNFAGIGFTYDSIDDAFIAPAPCEHNEVSLTSEKRWECSSPLHVVIIDES